MAGWIKMPLGMEVDLDPGDFVLDGDPAPLLEKGAEPPNFRPMFIVAKRLDGMDQDGTWHGGGPRSIDRAICQWRRRLECVVQQQGGHIEHLM